jgi:hypothetical protein
MRVPNIESGRVILGLTLHLIRIQQSEQMLVDTAQR